MGKRLGKLVRLTLQFESPMAFCSPLAHSLSSASESFAMFEIPVHCLSTHGPTLAAPWSSFAR